MKKPVKIFFAVLCVVFLCVFAYSGFRLYNIMHGYKESSDLNDGVRSQFVTTVTSLNQATGGGTTGLPGAQVNNEESPISVDFDSLLAQCPDVIGWIYNEGTPINYPVVQGTNNDFYLHRFLDGSYSVSGTIFLDWICARDFSGRNSILYGHNMNDGSMFASIRKYTDQAYYDEHPVMYLNTPTQNYKLELFSGYVIGATDPTTYGIGFVDDQEFMDYIEYLRSHSNFDSDVEVTASDRVVTLSTCTYEFDDARYVVHGKLVPIGGQTVTAQPEAPLG